MNPLAKELNSILAGTIAERLLSGLGRRVYFPRGIIAQAAEARQLAPVKNATIGMAFHGGQPLLLSAVAEAMGGLSPKETVVYAPTPGFEPVRQAWKDLLIRKNPSLDPGGFSLPVVVPGITAGISYAADLFLDEKTPLFTSDPCWENYGLIFTERRGAVLRGIPFFTAGSEGRGLDGGLDMEVIGRTLTEEAAKTGTLRLILNFPHNPSGYSPATAEAHALIGLINEIAKNGTDVLVICDDAYFGLLYEDAVYQESLFSALATLHHRVLAVKVDGPTKEDYVWGLRMGFVSFGSRGLGPEQHEALIKKLMGIIRSSVSCTNTPAQYLMLRALEDPRTAGEKQGFYEMLKRRYRVVKDYIRRYGDGGRLEPLPFNSGYFMSFRCKGIDPEALRRRLLSDHGIGTIALEPSFLRVAFAALEEEQIPEIYQTIYKTAATL
ncbi:MAG: aminotransferase class I/II-fold pyridoxal phosphate-dependent enzyme [Spirochaetaceae bacterium]|jgi:aspartate/methionine/tyrosine aminotransferase|nr:aminotransferase class I/II-fold pyridoxal phosphate-dependent enzyme [Spirochaetaceae bacterium]